LNKIYETFTSFKGCDSNFEVNIFKKIKSCYRWNIYLAFDNMYLDSSWNLW